MFLLGTLIFISCQREHSNIFDPENEIEILDLNLRIVQTDSVVSLSWRAPIDVSHSGFNLYRKIETEAEFKRIASLPANQFSFTDRDIQSQQSHAYYLSVQGNNIESPTTAVIESIPGPANFWVLDYWNFYVLHLSFDLQHILSQRYAVWRPQEMCFNTTGTFALITYPQYHFFEVFSPLTNTYIKGFDALKNPYACYFDVLENRFWISDTSGGIYTVELQSMELQKINASVSRPTQIIADAQNNVYVLNSLTNRVIQLNGDGTIIGALPQLGDSVKFIDIDPDENFIYSVNYSDSTRTLYRQSLTNWSTETFFSDSDLVMLRPSPLDESVWIVLNRTDSAEIVQLSANGDRLYTLKEFEHISDFNISRKTGYLIVADGGSGTVVHLKPDGSVIGTFDEAYYPFKVYIR